MIVAEPYQRDGRTCLRNLQRATEVPPGYVDTGLADLPGPDVGRLVWDGATATPLRDLPATENEKLDRLHLPPRVLAALVARAAPSSTPVQRTWAGQVLDAALVQIEQARQ